MSKPLEQFGLINSFGRRQGRKLTPFQKGLVNEFLPTIAVKLPESGALDWAALKGDYTSCHLEIGFGAGEHLLHMARHYPDILFIGCEPYMNGVAKLLAAMEGSGVCNIRLFTDDARLLMEQLPDDAIDKAYILFPDPWPKPRHYKRRIISAEMLDRIARIQPKAAKLLIATDHENYAGWILEKLLAHPAYEWQADSKEDWETPPKDWTQTRYQRKTSEEGRPPVFIRCERI